MIRIYTKKSKPKRKPGWQVEVASEVAWLKSLQALTVTGRTPKQSTKAFKPVQVVVSAPVVRAGAIDRPPSLMTPGGAGTKPVARPDILYKDNPSMLSRELEARARKFNVAPAYNKGGAQFVTEEELRNQLVGAKRRP